MSDPVILTADDPEPPDRSVVLDLSGEAWQSDDGFWRAGHAYFETWRDLCTLGMLTLIHRGPDPEPPTTWTFSDPEPPEGTVIALNNGTPFAFTATGWKGIYNSYYTDNPYTYQVLRWGWVK